jgi:predicted membrane protein
MNVISNLRKYILGRAIFDLIASILVVLVIANTFKLDSKITLIILLGIIPAGLLFHILFLVHYDNNWIQVGIVIVSLMFLIFSAYTRMQYYETRRTNSA